MDETRRFTSGLCLLSSLGLAPITGCGRASSAHPEQRDGRDIAPDGPAASDGEPAAEPVLPPSVTIVVAP